MVIVARKPIAPDVLFTIESFTQCDDAASLFSTKHSSRDKGCW